MATINNSYLDAITVVSPMQNGEDRKDQDRAVWFPVAQEACVCDGVTSSPYSAEAAELVCKFSPVLFSNDIASRLRAISDLLISMRYEKLHSPICLPPETPEKMKKILQEAAMQNIAHSFQTTMVTANFSFMDEAIVTSVIRCGDSMLMVFASNGELLASSPSNEELSQNLKANTSKNQFGTPLLCDIVFGPGDEILAKVLYTLSQYPNLCEKIGIMKEYANNWLLCTALDRCSSAAVKQVNKLSGPIQLKYGDYLVVPRYLAGAAVRANPNSYIRFPYSRMIRMINSTNGLPGNIRFRRPSSVTEVLPDHFYTGCWTYFQDRFPMDANFVLATDGFYNCFENPATLWSWLNEYRQDLQELTTKESLLQSLHCSLREKLTDDDISFVWIFSKRINSKQSVIQDGSQTGGKSHGA